MSKKNNDYDIYSVFEKQNKYKSPIEIITSGHLDNINRIVDGKIMSEITMRYGILVDEQELVKALSYDREQYKKGWIDGFREALEKPKPRTNFDRITSSVENLAQAMIRTKITFRLGKCAYYTYHETVNNKAFRSYDEALSYTIKWLKQEQEESTPHDDVTDTITYGEKAINNKENNNGKF